MYFSFSAPAVLSWTLGWNQWIYFLGFEIRNPIRFFPVGLPYFDVQTNLGCIFMAVEIIYLFYSMCFSKSASSILKGFPIVTLTELIIIINDLYAIFFWCVKNKFLKISEESSD